MKIGSMKIRFTLLMLVATALSVQISAQQSDAGEFGRMTASEFTASEALRGRNTDAVVLYSNGRYSFVDDEQFMNGVEPFPVFRKELVTRIKVLTEDGARYGVFEFPYLNFSYNVPLFEIEGYTYNIEESGELTSTPLGKSDIEDIQIDGDRRLKRVVFPDVKEGSVIELRCIEKTKFSRMPPWEFQQDIPVLSSQLVYTASPYLGYAVRLKGAKKYDYTDRKIVKGEQRAAYVTDPDHIVYVYGMNNMEAYPSEDYTNNADEDRIRMIFDLVTTVSPRTAAVTSNKMSWGEINSELAKNRDFGKFIKAAEKSYSKIKDIPADRSVTGVGSAIFGYVRDNYRWNGVTSSIASQRVPEFMKKKVGNSADINLYLIGLLRAAGMEATPVLLNVRNSGAIDKEAPSVDAFNYVVASVVIDGVEYFLDATERFAVFGELPERSSNAEGLYMVPDSERWGFTLQEQFSLDEINAEAAIDVAESVLNVSVTRSFEGNAAVNLRNDYTGGDTELAEILSAVPDTNPRNIAVENHADTGMPFMVKYGYTQPVEVGEDGRIVIRPLLMLAPDSNPFTGTGIRRFRVNMPFRPMDIYTMRIAVPEGYEVAGLPLKIVVNDDISFFTYSVQEEDGSVVLQAEYYLCRTDYPPATYSILQMRYDDMLKAFSQEIVFTPSAVVE